jgi:hypothetical protein
MKSGPHFQSFRELPPSGHRVWAGPSALGELPSWDSIVDDPPPCYDFRGSERGPVAPAVFKTVVPRPSSWKVGSIPTRFRHYHYIIALTLSIIPLKKVLLD